MARSRRYYTLISSLPYLPPLFTAKLTPLSRIKLDQRLSMLQPQDAAQLALIERFQQWDHIPSDLSDAAILRRAEHELPRIDSPVLRQVTEWRLELRSVIAALRRRRRGEPAPPTSLRWGYGRWVDHIRRHWNEPDFALGAVYPCIDELNRLLADDDVSDFERTLLGIAWQSLARAGDSHFFDFEAVVFYVLRWNIVARWSIYNGSVAQRRFDEMVEDALGDHGNLFAEPTPGGESIG